MRLNWKLISGILFLPLFLLSCEEVALDPIVVDDGKEVITPVVINFWNNGISIHENATPGMEIIIPFSGAAPNTGLVEIELQHTAAYGIHFNTVPAPTNGLLTLPVNKGDVEVKFSFIPIDNGIFNGHHELIFKVVTATGGVQKGANLGYVVTLLDDEMVTKPKSFETYGGDVLKRIYEYDTQGRIARVNWETQTPFVRTGTDTYFYDAGNKLIKITESPNVFTSYIWNGDRIIRSEKYKNGTMTQYVDYHYDNYGHVDESNYYYKQNQGEFKLGLVIAYLYFFDGNLYKVIRSTPIEGSNELVTLSTQTYDGYVTGSNPFPMVNILPTVNPQWKLPTFYQVEEHGFVFTYHITYQLNANGNPIRRDTSGNGGNQVTYYNYY